MRGAPSRGRVGAAEMPKADAAPRLKIDCAKAAHLKANEDAWLEIEGAAHRQQRKKDPNWKAEAGARLEAEEAEEAARQYVWWWGGEPRPNMRDRSNTVGPTAWICWSTTSPTEHLRMCYDMGDSTWCRHGATSERPPEPDGPIRAWTRQLFRATFRAWHLAATSIIACTSTQLSRVAFRA